MTIGGYQSGPIIDSVSCSPGGDCSCCDGGPFKAIFCCAVCIFCCATCTIKYHFDEYLFPAPEPAITPTRPTVVPIPGDPGMPNFTSSAFGAGIPIVFGSDRLPGNVFWHSGFDKKLTTLADGTQQFYYTTDFAIGICEGEINAVLRLWLGDQLVIDNSAAVDENGLMQASPDGYVFGSTIDTIGEDSPLKGADIAKTKISAFNGGPYQLPQGIYVDKEGYDDVPGYRGLAYILFENYVISDGTVPTMTVEVTANTQNLYPRLYGSRPLSGTIFNRVREALLYDPGYDTFYIGMDHTTNNKYGFVSFNGNNLDPLIEHDWITDYTPTDGDPDITLLDWNRAWVSMSGNIVHCHDNVNTGELLASANPYGNVIVDTSGRIVSGFSGHAAGGFAYLGKGSIMFTGPGFDGAYRSIICGISAAAVSNKSVGFMEVDDNDQLVMRGYLNNSAGGTEGRLVPYNLGATDATNNPLFSDGQVTANVNCVYAFTYDTNETLQFTVDRYIYRDATGVTTKSPTHQTAGTISFGDIAGEGFFHQIQRAFVDPTDNCFVLMVYTPQKGSYFVKWNPFTGAVVYAVKSSKDFSSVTAQAGLTEIVTAAKFCWLSQDTSIVSTNLTTGESVVIVEDLGDQDLPSPRAVENAFYNGRENSLTYLSDTVGKEVTKVFLERFTRNSVTLAAITRQLLQRVGWRDEYLDVNDLQALACIGYTIPNPKDLRAVFSELRQVFRFDLIESNGKILYKTRGSSAVATIDSKYLGDDSGEGHLKEIVDTDFAHLRKLNLTYRDIGRDYNTNVQSIALPKYQNTSLDNDAAIDVNVPVVLESDNAKKLAEILMYSKLIYEQAYEGTMDPRFQIHDPGDVVNIVDGSDTITVRFRDITVGEDKTVKFTASKEDPDIYNDQVNLFGSLGNFEGDTFDPIQPRIDPFILPIPFRNRTEAAETTDKHFLFLTFLNTRTSTVFDKPVTVNISGTTAYAVAPPTNYPTWGVVTQPLAARASLFSTDYTSQLRVRLFNTTGAALNSLTKDQLLANSSANLALVGTELIQFQTVTDEGDGFYLFTGLHRCRFGTETSARLHTPGEKFILLADDTGALDTGSVRRLDLPTADGPKRAAQVFLNSNNPFQPTPTRVFLTTNLRPWAVGGGKGVYSGDDCVISWSYRSRYDGQYADDLVETVPFYDGVEEYTLHLMNTPTGFSASDPSTYLRKVIVNDVSTFVYDAAMQAEDGFDNLNDTLYVRIYMSGNLTGVDTGLGTVITVSHKR